MSIVLKHVTKKIKKNTVLEDINIQIEYGRVTGFKGNNGSGKTMLMRMISGLIYPTSGSVIIDGRVLGKDISFPESIGVLLESPAFINSYSGYDNLCLLADIKSVITKDDIVSALQDVGLTEATDKKYRKYSLGMKQRLGIAATIMEKPNIIILDEPTNSLDDNGIMMVKEIVKREKERGAAVIISCHDAELLDDICDEMITIQNGIIQGSYNP